MKNLFVVDNLSVNYEDKKVLDNVSFSVSEKEMVAVLCPNNCGKTTLIKTLSGVIYKNSGSVFLNGIMLSKRNFKRYSLNFGVVFEDIDYQFICDRVEDELRFPLINLAYQNKTIDSRISLVSKVLKLDNILDKKIDSLSTYEKLRVLIAVSIIHFPKILLLDDVFKLITLKESKSLLALLNEIKSEFGISVLYTTSSINNVIGLEHIVVLGRGNKFMESSFDSIIKEDNELTKMGFEIPLMIDLSRKLQFYDLVDSIYYDVDKVVDKLWK